MDLDILKSTSQLSFNYRYKLLNPITGNHYPICSIDHLFSLIKNFEMFKISQQLKKKKKY